MTKKILAAVVVLLVAAAAQNTTPDARPRASDLGLKVGILPTGPVDAITDVAGVEVGHCCSCSAAVKPVASIGRLAVLEKYIFSS